MSNEISEATANSLATKLEGLELSDEEHAALDALLERAAAADDGVEGFGVVFEVETTFRTKVAGALGLFPSRNISAQDRLGG